MISVRGTLVISDSTSRDRIIGSFTFTSLKYSMNSKVECTYCLKMRFLTDSKSSDSQFVMEC